jgi:hypothetical protein
MPGVIGEVLAPGDFGLVAVCVKKVAECAEGG